LLKQTKPFCISKEEVWESYLSVKRNKGCAGVDKESLEAFDEKAKENLYKIWNRMSSGSYYPPSVLTVSIPKQDGKVRKLGIPTVGDRIAQMVVKRQIEPRLEEIFHEDSYGYRPNKSAIQAIDRARKRCWQNNWVVDIDIKGFFDNINHDLLMKTVEHHVKESWIKLYIKRWLTASSETRSGEQTERTTGIPQGGVISPLLANLFLHYVLDNWLARNYSHIPFERYADDIIIHCKSENQAKMILSEIRKRMQLCSLELHPDKTKIIYCKDKYRNENHPEIQFDFLGYTFKPRKSKHMGKKYLIRFGPGMSRTAKIKITEEIKQWNISRRTDLNLEKIAEEYNPKIRGWLNYYGQFYKSELYGLFYNLNLKLLNWAKRKYKRFQYSWKKAKKWFGRIIQKEPNKFAHWKLCVAI